ncbi:MAG: UbiA family prenyltransferase [Candidatus Dadabacteria bacterium]|nr:MAG: UbiA family prenyltransferase [Candidatus Dadabacteria bacterium]
MSEKSTICVDLDGTLIHTDLLYESLAKLIKEKPLLLCFLPFWILRGRSFLKKQLADRISIGVDSLPYNHELLAELKVCKERGNRLVLVTASEERLATDVARHLGIFDAVYGTTAENNLKGENKRVLLSNEFGAGRYVYVGDSKADIPVWRSAASAWVVVSGKNPLNGVEDIVADRIFKRDINRLRVLLRTLRVHQWSKNVLLFVPLMLAHRLKEVDLVLQAFYGFFAFSLCASAGYIINDILDLDADRQHRSKKFRPIASGEMPLKVAFLLVPLLLIFAGMLSWLLPDKFLLLVVLYFLATVSYSVWLKKIVLVDVIVLALLYTIRIIAGGAATTVPVSHWLVVFSMFLFLSLACVKRYAELKMLDGSDSDKITGRGYDSADINLIGRFGVSAGYISVLVIAMYVHGGDVQNLYTLPEVLWLICPLLLYWVSRIWLIAEHGKLNDDPVVYALLDRVSYLVAGLMFLVMFLAT